MAVRMLNQPGGFLPALEGVQALDGLAAGALHEIVDGAHDDEAAGATVETPREVEAVGVGDMLRVR